MRQPVHASDTKMHQRKFIIPSIQKKVKVVWPPVSPYLLQKLFHYPAVVLCMFSYRRHGQTARLYMGTRKYVCHACRILIHHPGTMRNLEEKH